VLAYLGGENIIFFLGGGRYFGPIYRPPLKVLVGRLVDYFVELGEDPEDMQAATRLLQQPQHLLKILNIILNFVETPRRS
jgi:hypothetical protein